MDRPRISQKAEGAIFMKPEIEDMIKVMQAEKVSFYQAKVVIDEIDELRNTYSELKLFIIHLEVLIENGKSSKHQIE